MKCKHLIIVIAVIFIQGCAVPYSSFYIDQTGGADIAKNPRVIVTNESPQLFRGGDPQKDALAMSENGFVRVGYSSFNASNVNENGAIVQAKKVHASVVLIYSEYSNTVSGIMPLTLPDTQTSTTSLHGNAYGSGGDWVNYSGTATTTTYGSRTTYMPYSVDRYDYLATYWVKLRPLMLGVQVQDLTSKIRNEIQSNKGVMVTVVIKRSPAFYVDILKGDVLKRIDNTEIDDSESFLRLISKHEGQNITIVIYRNGKIIEKQVQLNKDE